MDHPPSTSPRTRSSGTMTSSKKTSQNSRAPCIVSIGRTVMPGLSMSTNSAVIPLCADSGVPVRVRSTHRCAYWARLVHTFWPLTLHPSSVRHGPAGEGGQIAPGPRLGEPLAPDLLAAQEPRHHRRGQIGRRVVDHRRRQHLGHGVDAGLDEVAGGQHLAEIRPQEVRSAQPAHAVGPAHAHEAGVVGQSQHLAQLRHLLVERPHALVGGCQLALVRVQPVVDGGLELGELHRAPGLVGIGRGGGPGRVVRLPGVACAAAPEEGHRPGVEPPTLRRPSVRIGVVADAHGVGCLFDEAQRLLPCPRIPVQLQDRACRSGRGPSARPAPAQGSPSSV